MEGHTLEAQSEAPISPQEEENINNENEHGSDSSDSDDEAQLNLQMQALESALSTDPSNYYAHVQYIKILRKLGELEKLRQARESMRAIFPLSPSMWQEWTKDEASLSTGPDTVTGIEKLYEQGVFDYLSVSLWCNYLNFVQEYDPSVRECSHAGISKARNLFERAITAAGLHVAEGSKIWEAYREFEQAILLTIDESDIEEKRKQVQRIRSIFHRQLSVPLDNLESTLLAYKAWEGEQGIVLDVESNKLDGISSHVASAYQKALEMYNARFHLEEQISRQDISDSEKFQQYMVYLKFEQSSGDPVRVQVLYERAITEFPVSSDLWLDYVRYLDKTLKVGKVVRDVYSRATKGCPWIGELWVRYLLCLERGHASEEEISTVFEKSLESSFAAFEEYLDLFLTRIDGLRRRISSAIEGEAVLDYSLVRTIFQQASDYLSPTMKNTEGLLRLHAYWARLELNLGKDLVAARTVWESFLKHCGTMLEAWQGYITMEVELGHLNEARSIYRRCYSKRFAGTGSEDICNAWLRFEREFGTLEDLDHAVQKVTPRLEELQLLRLQQESKSLSASADQREQTLRKTSREKRKQGPNIGDEQSPIKRQKNKGENSKKTEVQQENLAEINDVEKGKETKTKVEKPDNLQQMRPFNPGKNKVYSDQCTAFISNLNFKANDEDLRKFFSDVGGVVSIRILHDKFTGKSRGLAYVDFTDDDHLAAAVAKNRMMLLGKKLSIARSNPKQRKKESGGRGVSTEPVELNNEAGTARGSESKVLNEASMTAKESRPTLSAHSAAHKRGESIQLKGKNTFAMPRNVRPLGWTANEPKTTEGEDEKPKSNDEFRKMFIKG